MPGAASCQSATVALVPARFRGGSDRDERKSGHQDAPIPTGLPRPRVASKSSKAPSETGRSVQDAPTSSTENLRASDPTNRCQVPAVSSSQQQKPLSIMELVNQAARREEKQEALVRAGVCASPRIASSSRGASPRGAPFFSPFGSSRDVRDSPRSSSAARPPVASSPRARPSSGVNVMGTGSTTPRASAPAAAGQHTQATAAISAASGSPTGAKAPAAVGASKPPLSPMGSPATAAHRHASASLFAAHTAAAAAAASPRGPTPPVASGFAAAAAAAAAAAPSSTTRPTTQQNQQQQLANMVPVPHPAGLVSSHACDCASDDGSATGSLTPESSLCSSASNSSLCSYGSLASSSCSSISRPKSILVRRSASASGASSPGGTAAAAKSVRWRDGESVRGDAGADLVAVLLLHDTPEIRRLRKDTWPERPKGGRDTRDTLTVTIPSLSSSKGHDSSSSSSKSTGTPQAEASQGHPLVATVKDWKEKLRALSAERRAQRVAALQDTWTARQAAQQRQIQQRQQQRQQQEAELAVPGTAAAADVDVPAATAAAAKPAAAAGPVITLQAVASCSSISQACC